MHVLLLVVGACGRVDFDEHEPQATTRYYQAAMDSQEVSIAIEPVDPARTLVICDHNMAASIHARTPLCELVDGDTLRLFAFDAGGTATVYAQVIEFARGAYVQRGRAQFTASDLSITVPVAGLSASSFAVVTRSLDNPFAGADFAANVAAELTSSELVLSRTTGGDALDAAWQVVRLDDAYVQAGVTRLEQGSSETSIALDRVDRDHALSWQAPERRARSRRSISSATGSKTTTR